MKRIAILGSTGSVGVQTLDVVASFPDRYRVSALAGGRNLDRLVDQVRRFRPERVSVADPASVAEVRARLGDQVVEIESGPEGLEAVAVHDSDLVMAALVGAVGLAPTLAAIRAGREIALANKEVMVMAGALVLREARRHGVSLVPVDSEHSAIFQVLAQSPPEFLHRLILTASGGPFRTWGAEKIARASIEQALAHPNWDMGPKISIDSATLMNKGLEVIEARWFFDVPPQRIDVVVHPQSIVHSLVEFVDTSVLAQLGLPDMRVPIAVALAHPERLPLDLPQLDLARCGRLDFEEPDRKRFPCLDLAFEALAASEAAPAVLNAANEIFVAAFLAGRISFLQISAGIEAVLAEHVRTGGEGALSDLGDVLASDAWSRQRAQAWLDEFGDRG